MKTKTTLAAICLTLTLSLPAFASLGSTLGVSTGLVITNLVLGKINPDTQKEFQASIQLGTLASTGLVAAVTLIISDGLDFLSSNKRTKRLDQVLSELRENDELKDKSDEELTMMIISLAEDMN